MSEELAGATGNVVSAPSFGRLGAIISVFGINKAIWQAADSYFNADDHRNEISLSEIVSVWNLNSIHWEVLELRVGSNGKHTYEVIGEDLGVGRARIQQIVQKALIRLGHGFQRTAPLLNLLDARVPDLWPLIETIVTLNSAIFVQEHIFKEIGWVSPAGEDIRRLLLAFRALVSADMLIIPNKFPNLCYFACRLFPEIEKHPQVAAELTAREEKGLRWTYERVVEAVLEEVGEPMHYTQIAKMANEMDLRPDISLKMIHNVLYSKTEKFALVNQGTYGLTSWGLTSVDSYVNIIAEALRTSNRVMTLSEISFCVNNKRPIKPQSLQMTLDLNPRFYRTAAITYGLRAWLPVREKQTLRTPAWQIEDPFSYERVGKAVERGYDVDMIVAMDKI